MKRLTLGITAILAAASPSWASEHLMKVGEVLLSTTTNGTNAQYIELEDPAPGEPFANTYGLVVYDTNGNQVGNTIALAVPQNTAVRMLVATDEAVAEFVGVTRDADLGDLGAILPNPGQACFERTGGTGGPKTIHCLGWGTVATAVQGELGGTNAGMAPGAGEALQLSGGNYVVDTPNPDAPNVMPPPPPPDAAVDARLIDAAAMPDGGIGPGATGDRDGGCCGVGANPGLAAMAAFLVLIAIGGRRRAKLV
jgi:hypothetical protein